MADVDSYNPAKQLKKEKKEQERLQKEREKQEKKLEKERKKREESERKQREKEARKKAKDDKLLTANGGASTEPNSTGELASGQAPAAEPPQSPPGAAAAAETAATDGNDQRSASSPEKVAVAEPPGQITGYGEPIGISFDVSRAGEGPMTASCAGTKVGAVPAAVTESRPRIYRVQFTPNAADVYTLSVKWGGREINGSPFTINLSRLSSAAAVGSTPQPAKEVEKDKEKVKEERKTEQAEEVEEVSDDPFEMAFQASRLLEEQRQQTAASFSSDSSSTSGPPPQPHSTHQQTHSESSSPPYQPVPVVTRPATRLVYPAANQPLPFPEGFPATKEDVTYLEGINKQLQQTNEGLGKEVADLKKKMGEFEEKLTNIEETSKAAEVERKELMANISLRGWLYKRGIKGPTANVWRNRYFRCDQGNKIYYYKAADEPTPKGYIDLENVESVETVENEEQSDSAPERFCFNITCADRTYQLQTDSEDTRRQWITAVQYLKNWHQKNKSTLRSLALSQKE